MPNKYLSQPRDSFKEVAEEAFIKGVMVGSIPLILIAVVLVILNW